MPVHHHRSQKDINLLSPSHGNNSITEQLLTWALTYGRYIIIITQIIVLSVFFARFKLDRDQTDLKDAALEKQALIEQISEFEKDVKTLQKKIEYVKQSTVNQELLTSITGYLEEKIPSDIVFINLNLTPDKISFSAESPDLLAFSSLLKTMQYEDRFTDIILENINRRNNGSLNFKISARINPKKFI